MCIYVDGVVSVGMESFLHTMCESLVIRAGACIGGPLHALGGVRVMPAEQPLHTAHLKLGGGHLVISQSSLVFSELINIRCALPPKP